MTNFSCVFDPERPDGCPPPDAEQRDVAIFRHVKALPVVDAHFHSDVKIGARYNNPEKCECWGCSVWVNEAAVQHAVSLFPHFRKKYVVSGQILASHGAIMHTGTNSQPDHHTFWFASDQSISSRFSVYMKDGEIV